MITQRETPYSRVAEQSALGACLVFDKEAIAMACGLLNSSDFYMELHKKIFRAIATMFEAREEIDVVTVTEWLRKSGQIDEVGGPEYLSALVDACASSVNIESYAKIILDNATKRKAIAAAQEITNLAYSDISADELAAKSEKLIGLTGQGSKHGEISSVSDAMVRVVERTEQQMQNRGKLLGLSTGFADLDDLTDGFEPEHLVVLAARPSMGKTALAMECCYHVAKQGRPVFVGSFEMSKSQLVQRLVCNRAKVESKKVKRGTLNEFELERYMDAVEEISRLPIFIYDASGGTSRDVRNYARRIASENGPLGLVMIDYLQKMGFAKEERENNMADTLKNVLINLTALSKDQKCSVLLLSQLNREVEKRDPPIPQMGDLRDSGAIEAEAWKIWMLYRQGYYDRKKNPMGEFDDSKAQVFVPKNRDGDTGSVMLRWEGRYTRFDNLAPDAEPDYDPRDHRVQATPAPVWNSGRDYGQRSVTI